MPFTSSQIKDFFNVADKEFQHQPEILAERIAEAYYETDISSAIKFGCQYSLSHITIALKTLKLNNEQQAFLSNTFYYFNRDILSKHNRQLSRLLEREHQINSRIVHSLTQLIAELLPKENKDFSEYFSRELNKL